MVADLSTRQLVLLVLFLAGVFISIVFIYRACCEMKCHYPDDKASTWIVFSAAFAVCPVLNLGVPLMGTLVLISDRQRAKERSEEKRKTEVEFASFLARLDAQRSRSH